MIDREVYDHARFEGARIVLKPFQFSAVPEDAAERNTLLEPMIRALDDAQDRGGRTLYEVAAELYAAADVIEAGEDIAMRGVSGPPKALREIAEHVATWSVGRAGRLTGVTPTSAELAFRFPQLISMLIIYYGQDGIASEDDALSPRESLGIAVDDYHPWCLWRLPHIAAECQEALAVFQTEEALQQFFGVEQSAGTPGLPWLEWLPLIIDVLGEHMRAEHPPHWVHTTR